MRLGQGFQLDVRDEALSALDALNRVFVHVQTAQLEQIRQAPLGQLRRSCFAQGGYPAPAEIKFSIRSPVFIHENFVLTFSACHSTVFFIL